MSPPTRRSRQERLILTGKDQAMSRVTDNPKVTMLDPPDRIKANDRKLDSWEYICKDLASRELLSPSYYMSIIILVDNIHHYNEYIVTLDESGALVPMFNKDGTEVIGYKENPIFSMVKRVEQTIIRLTEKFGMNPRDAVYTTNPDLKTRIEQTSKMSSKANITYFND